MHFLHDVSVQKPVVVVESPILQGLLRCNRRHPAEALVSANRWEHAASVDPSTTTRALRELWQSLAPLVVKLTGQARVPNM